MFDPQEVHATSLLNALPALGPRRIKYVIDHYKSARAALDHRSQWPEHACMDTETLDKVKEGLNKARESADKDLKFIELRKPHIYLAHTGPYPSLLRQISAVPPIIYAMGQPLSDPVQAVALVGSRRCSYYGERMARKLAGELADAGVIIISGLARRIDTHAHKATLDAGGATWAVIGSGLGQIYPPENKGLAQRIQEGGAIISEFPAQTEPFAYNFPRRNRVIAGLSLATVVIEGGAISGALITARLAAEEGRDVFAVPNPVGSPYAAAPNRLLKEGAGLVESAEDILQELEIGKPGCPANGSIEVSGAVEQVLNLVGGDILHRDQLSSRMQLKPEIVSSLLVEMELKGLIKLGAGGFVSKT